MAQKNPGPVEMVLLQDSAEHWSAHEHEKTSHIWRKNHLNELEGTVPNVLTGPRTALVLAE